MAPAEDGEEVNDFSDQGFEIEPTIAPLSKIINAGVNSYYVSEPSSSHIHGGVWWSSHSDMDIRTGVEKTYSLHISHADGSKLSDEEAKFIDHLIKNRKQWEEPYEQEPGTWD